MILIYLCFPILRKIMLKNPKILSLSEVFCVFIITCVIIGIIAICLYNINNKILKYFKNIKFKNEIIL